MQPDRYVPNAGAQQPVQHRAARYQSGYPQGQMQQGNPQQSGTYPQQPAGGQYPPSWQTGSQPAQRQPVQQPRPAYQPTNPMQPAGGSHQPYQPQVSAHFQPVRQGNGSGQPPKKKKGSSLLFALIALVIIAALAFGGVTMINQNQTAQFVSQYDDVFCPGVYVDGVHLGGLTAEQGMKTVQDAAAARDNAWYVTLTYEGEVVTTLTSAQLGMITDVTQALNDAWAQGRNGTNEERKAAIENLLTTPYYGYTVTPGGDRSVVDNVLDTIAGFAYVAPQDAVFVGFDPTRTDPFVIQNEVVGRMLETGAIKEQIYQMVATRQSGMIEVTPVAVQPAVTAAMLRSQYGLRAAVLTEISSTSTTERTNNIKRSFEQISGYELKPGETFSFNKIVGKRTLENGFFEADEYAYNMTVKGVGGGVCQASSTLYKAVVEAGLEIVHREPHSKEVNYCGYGEDATVYWEYDRQIDFKFKNNTDQPIYIKAAVESNPNNKKRFVAKVYIYGAPLEENVAYKLETRVIQELPAPTEPEYKKDTGKNYVTYTDEEYQYSKAHEGYVVESYRVKYVNKVAVEHTLLYTDTYKERPAIVYVGTTKRPEE